MLEAMAFRLHRGDLRLFACSPFPKAIDMKLATAFTALLSFFLASPTLAETTSALVPDEPCHLDGPLNGTTDECRALRIDYRTNVSTCMQQMHAEADARAGGATKVSAHANRARHFTCDAETRATLELKAK
jgi:hypothetical protein